MNKVIIQKAKSCEAKKNTRSFSGLSKGRFTLQPAKFKKARGFQEKNIEIVVQFKKKKAMQKNRRNVSRRVNM